MADQPMKCRHCGETVYPRTGHYCEKLSQNFYADDDSFLVSLVVAAATESTALGTLVGGSLTGALVGDALNGDIIDRKDDSSDGTFDDGGSDTDTD
jgi:hypothetical protein